MCICSKTLKNISVISLIKWFGTYADGQPLSRTQFPTQFWGDWYSIDQGVELHTFINSQQLKNEKIADSECVGVDIYNETIDAQGNYDGRIVVFNKYGAAMLSLCQTATLN